MTELPNSGRGQRDSYRKCQNFMVKAEKKNLIASEQK